MHFRIQRGVVFGNFLYFSGNSNGGVFGGGAPALAESFSAIPDPPTHACLEKKKARETAQKSTVFLFTEPLNSLENKEKRIKKQGTSGKGKKQGNQKKVSVGGSGKSPKWRPQRRHPQSFPYRRCGVDTDFCIGFSH